VEQLIAESTGKQGTGCVPVPTTEPEVGPDRHVVPLHQNGPADLGEQFYRWEVAVALCGHVLGVDPFDEPNVAESKKNTNDVLGALPLPQVETVAPSEVFPWLDATVTPGDYVSLQAYVPFGHDADLESLRRRVRDHLGGAATTVGYGPRFLHSTGQLHKGGPNSVVAVQIVDAGPLPAVPIPDKPYGFGTLIAAQAIGDHRSLLAHGRRVLRVATHELGAIA
jgi:glucose-6-phosphate isomerase/transaldolase/glucose-6-phosphate isomerase